MRRPRPAESDQTAGERGAIRKKWKDRLPVALVFPNSYRVGMSNLGFQIVYRLLNEHDGIVAERFFVGESLAESRSVESNRPLSDFPVLCCSFCFEADFPTFVALLTAGGIIPLAAQRRGVGDGFTAGQPLIVGGGVAAMINPEPLAPYVDVFVVGEAEPVLEKLIALLLRQYSGELELPEMLVGLAGGGHGFYVPSLYEPEYQSDGKIRRIVPREGAPLPVKKVLVQGSDVSAYSSLVSPATEFSDIFLAELGRGCSRSCRFCAAGFVYRPPRLWSADSIVTALSNRPDGVERVGLLGMEMARPEDLAAISSFLLNEDCSLSFSSLRADALGPELIGLLAESGLKTAAIAPDAGSERLRRVINKNISEEDVLYAAESLAGIGIVNLKLYCMIGLPTETEADLAELVRLAMKVKEILLEIGRRRKRVAHLTLSLNCFVPKPWTPFQYHPFLPITDLKKRISYLRASFSGVGNVTVHADKPENAYLQSVLAKGDRRLGLALDCCLGGGNPRRRLAAAGVDSDWYALRPRTEGEILPWGIIDHGIDRGYLWSEYCKALAEKTTPACQPAVCRRCGVCS